MAKLCRGVSNLAHKIVDLTDTHALVLLVEMDRRVFCVVRSRTPSFDAAAAAGALGGGGHEQAASAIYRGPLADAQREILAALPAAVSEPLRARDVMSKPARVVAPSDTVAEAMALCQRYNQSGVLVTDDGKLVGSVAREDLDRARPRPVPCPRQGDHERPRTRDRSRCAPVRAPAAPRRLGGGQDRDHRCGSGRRRGHPEVLRALGEAAEPADDTGESIATELGRFLAERSFAIAAASEGVEGVYLVGGTVRDILLGEDGFDVDIAVEGDAIGLARRIARELDGRTREHEKFGTAVVLYGDGERVDVVTARTEFYDAPAALPAVEHASIRGDLFRRDFTINAMAASLRVEDFGRLVDPFGGREDLAVGTLRVLHNLSFIEDPTRIFRAIRYENRYGFRMDEHTARLARSCVEMGLVGDLSSARLRDELTALLEEGEVRHSLPRLAELGAAGASIRTLPLTTRLWRYDRGRKLARALGVDLPDWRLGLAVLARRMPAAEVTDWLDRLKLRKRDADLVAAAVAVGPRIVSSCARRRCCRRTSWRWPSSTLLTRRCSRSRSRSSSRSRPTSRSSGTCSSTWQERSSRSWGSVSRRAWARSLPSSGDGSSTASSTAATPSWPRRRADRRRLSMSALELIRWEAPGPYEVVFSTRTEA